MFNHLPCINTQVVKDIKRYCGEEARKLLLLLDGKENIDTNGSNSSMFGINIPYNEARVVWPDTNGLHKMSEEKINSNTDRFTMMIHETKPQQNARKSVVSIR